MQKDPSQDDASLEIVIIVAINYYSTSIWVLFQKENKSSVEIVNTWHPNITLNLVEDYTPWTPGAIPAPLNECKLLLLLTYCEEYSFIADGIFN